MSVSIKMLAFSSSCVYIYGRKVYMQSLIFPKSDHVIKNSHIIFIKNEQSNIFLLGFWSIACFYNNYLTFL